jgi:hypothetical protein
MEGLMGVHGEQWSCEWSQGGKLMHNESRDLPYVRLMSGWVWAGWVIQSDNLLLQLGDHKLRYRHRIERRREGLKQPQSTVLVSYMKCIQQQIQQQIRKHHHWYQNRDK